MTKPNLGKKQTCKSCEARFFDLNKNPAVCPKCGEEIKISKSKIRRSAAPAPDAVAPSAPTAATIPARKVVDDDDDDMLDDDDLDIDEIDDLDDDMDDDMDDEPDDDDLMEDTSDMGEDNDDLSEVLDHVDDAIADK